MNFIFPTDDLSAYRITAPPIISEEDEDRLFKRSQPKDDKKKKLSKEDQKVHDLMLKKSLLLKWGLIEADASLEEADIDLNEMIAFSFIKKEALSPALKALGFKKRNKVQSTSNLFFRLIQRLPTSSVKLKHALSLTPSRSPTALTEKIELERKHFLKIKKMKNEPHS